MGYELKMKIGWLGSPSVEHKRKTKLERDGDSLWYPYEKDDKGEYIPTGRNERIFFELASIDLGKIYDTETYKIASNSMLTKEQREKVKIVVKWFNSPNTLSCVDRYGDMPKPVPVGNVLKALREDVKATNSYHLFVWALALLESIKQTENAEAEHELTILFEGH